MAKKKIITVDEGVLRAKDVSRDANSNRLKIEENCQNFGNHDQDFTHIGA